MIQMNLFSTETDSQTWKTNFGYQRGDVGGRDKLAGCD